MTKELPDPLLPDPLFHSPHPVKKQKLEDQPLIPVEKDGDRLCCMFVLPHKQGRQCKMTRRKGDKFCALHKNTDPSATDRDARVPCPINPKHTILKRKLNQHVKKCNSNPSQEPEQPWFQLDMNVAEKQSVDKSDEDTFEKEEYQHMGTMLEQAWKDIISKHAPELEQLQHQGVNDRLSQLENPKHAIQQSSLIGHMDKIGLLDYEKDNTLLATIEFGCGRAELSRYVSRAQYFKYQTNKLLPESHAAERPFLLIDRGGPRMKFDTKILKDYKEEVVELDTAHTSIFTNDKQHQREKTELEPEEERQLRKLATEGKVHPFPHVERTKIDIKDLNLNSCLEHMFDVDQQNASSSSSSSSSSPSSLSIAAISKHLCGCATDLTLQCLANALQHDSAQPRPKLQGLVIALCCRQICSYETYPLPGRQFLIDSNIVSTPKSFKLLTKMTSWAINGRRENMPSEQESAQHHPSGYSTKQREHFGLLARRAIDYGRLLFLQSLGYKARLVQYVDSSVSLENVALICSAD